jgi:hypothetical protein
MEKIALVLMLLAGPIAYAQTTISLRIVEVGTGEAQSVAAFTRYDNRGHDSVAIFLQNWRAVKVGLNQQVFGYPYVPTLINRFIFMPDSSKVDSLGGRIEDNFMGDIGRGTFRLLPPHSSFTIAVVFRDSVILNEWRSGKLRALFLGSIAPYHSIRKIVAQHPDVLFSESECTMVIPDLPIDRGREWRKAMIDYSGEFFAAWYSDVEKEEILLDLSRQFVVVSAMLH